MNDIGVGPWEGPLPAEDHFDPELLANGDQGNVVDRYRYWKMEAIIADLDKHRHQFAIAIENWQHDFNIGSVVRTANAFLVQEIVIVGKRRWNRRGAMVTDRYQHISHCEDVEQFVEWAGNRPIVGIDNLPGSKPTIRPLSMPGCLPMIPGCIPSD